MVYVGTAALGCPAERSSAALASMTPNHAHAEGELALARQPRAAVPTYSLLQPHALLRNYLPNLLHKLRRRHILGLLFPARADVHLPGLRLFISNHKQERNLLHRM